MALTITYADRILLLQVTEREFILFCIRLKYTPHFIYSLFNPNSFTSSSNFRHKRLKNMTPAAQLNPSSFVPDFKIFCCCIGNCAVIQSEDLANISFLEMDGHCSNSCLRDLLLKSLKRVCVRDCRAHNLNGNY